MRTVNAVTGNYEIPVDGDPVDLMLDVSDTGGQTMAAYAASQPELVTNGTFDTNVDGWVLRENSTLSWVDGEAEVNVTGSGGGIMDAQPITVVAGETYEVSVSMRAGTYAGAFGFLIENVTLAPFTLSSTTKTFKAIVVAGDTDLNVQLNRRTVSTGTVYIDNISVKKISSHAAIAPSDSARPTLASYNSPISSREVLTTTYSWTITDGGRA